jgi:outer membrane protein insertion porin family
MSRSISQLRDFDSDRLEAAADPRKGDWYNAKLVEDTIEQLTDTAGTVRLCLRRRAPALQPRSPNRTMDVTFVPCARRRASMSSPSRSTAIR